MRWKRTLCAAHQARKISLRVDSSPIRPDRALAARRLGAEQIVLMGHHKQRTDLGREFGATDVVAARGEEGIELTRELTGGDGTHTVLERVGTSGAIGMALGVARGGGVVSRVGAAQYTEVPMDFGTFLRNITLTGGVAPARGRAGTGPGPSAGP